VSLYAVFQLIKKSDFPRFIAALELPPPKHRSVAAVKAHPYRKFVVNNMTELAEYQWSGYVFAFELAMFLKTHSIKLEEFALAKPTGQLAKYYEFGVMVFSGADAKRLAEKLDEILDGQKLIPEIEKFLKRIPPKSSRMSDKLPAQAVFDALLILRYWLSRVEKNQFGILVYA